MGQSLAVQITMAEKELAVAYFHWDGYTSVAFERIRQFMNGLKYRHEENPVLKAVRLFESVGAGITYEESIFALHHLPSGQYRSATTRDEGLIAVDSGTMLDYWSDADMHVDIDIERKRIELQAFAEYDEPGYREVRVGVEGWPSYEDLPVFKGPSPNGRISFADFNDVYTELKGMLKESVVFKNSEGNALLAIE